MADRDASTFTSPANVFLQQEVYRLGNSPGLRHLPPGPERDFIVLTWGPVIYRTSYVPESKHLLPVFLRLLNDAVSRSIHRILIGSAEQVRLLEKTYASKVFSVQDMYDSLDEDRVRDAFHDYKVSLAMPVTELPSRLRACLMVDDEVLSHMRAILDIPTMAGQDTDVGRCWVKVIEDNFPDARFGDKPYIASIDGNKKVDGTKEHQGKYRGWTMVSLSALLEVFDGLRQMKYLVEYHREGRIYLGEGKWSAIK
ncbi:hypothetical protein N7481_005331 [Penicillium waksmanii]|uniref:uncharacterized protein n=1 Tax=Penicillium waksmanii TaxID=69791 RepID=UPI002546ACD3|nr:uncharacterized protein N7481_005331 [Penicillium waksmanii]KAJ5983232.1 hypothetical protein N7481_005331 [Penicillium waksmanii]